MNLEAIQQRRDEVAQYDANIAMYQSIVANLPSWDSAPEHLLQYRGAKNEHEVAGQLENLDDVVLLSQLLYADTCHRAIRSEMLERTKAAAILTVLEAQAPSQ